LLVIACLFFFFFSLLLFRFLPLLLHKRVLASSGAFVWKHAFALDAPIYRRGAGLFLFGLFFFFFSCFLRLKRTYSLISVSSKLAPDIDSMIVLALFLVLVQSVDVTLNNLAFSAAQCGSFGVDATTAASLTGGCAKLTFCSRGSGGGWGSTLFGYKANTGISCLSPGPVIRMQPGKVYGVVLCVDSTISGATAGTNLHTHGLHISGAGNSDDPSRWVKPGGCTFYRYSIPSNHMGGTMWYHPHLHMHTYEQVSGGALGMILIGEQAQDATIAASDGLAADRTSVYNFLTEPTRELLLVAVNDGGNWKNANHAASATNTYSLTPGLWYRLRILTVNPNAEPETLTVSSGCTAHAIAHDGVFRFQPPKAAATSYYLTGASRLDLAIKCVAGTTNITMSQGWNNKKRGEKTTRKFWGDNAPRWGGQWDGDGWSGSQTIASFVVSGTTQTTATHTPFLGTDSWVSTLASQWTSVRPSYLVDFSQQAVVDNTFSVAITPSSANGLAYCESKPLKDCGTTADFVKEKLNEWTILTVDQHPFHLHLYHMQIQGTTCGAGHDAGEFYDIIGAVQSVPGCKVRFRTAEIGGRTTIHCHILRHEDNGAMGWINVVNTNLTDQTPTTPCCLSGQCSTCVAEKDEPNTACSSGGHKRSDGRKRWGGTSGTTFC
jgi:FtsP/CotA-like multicopper oxidase with cupredoxin domain